MLGRRFHVLYLTSLAQHMLWRARPLDAHACFLFFVTTEIQKDHGPSPGLLFIAITIVSISVGLFGWWVDFETEVLSKTARSAMFVWCWGLSQAR